MGEKLGVNVLRFTNLDILKYFDEACAVMNAKYSQASKETTLISRLRRQLPQGKPRSMTNPKFIKII